MKTMMKNTAGSKFLFCLCVLMVVLVALFTGCNRPKVRKTQEPPIAQEKPSKPVSVVPWDVLANCVFAGWMGDATKAVTLDDAYTTNPQTPPTCVKITYRIPSDSVDKWAGIYAQFNVKGQYNWGDYPGRDLTGYTKLVWYAKGETGNEMVEFKAGGINTPGKTYKDSFERTFGTIKLGKGWNRYEMDLSKENLSSVIGGFCWIATKRSNPNGLTFYIDSVTYE